MAIPAKGTFEVKLTPQTDSDSVAGRCLIDKQFRGDLDATSKGQMLGATTAVKGSAGYVAIEQVTGLLHDANGAARKGAFALQHFGIMNRGALEQNVVVVPDSGTGELVGLAGAMTIVLTDGKHSYEFVYTLPEVAP